MKTTLDIDDDLLIKAKEVCASEQKSLTALVEEGLRLRLHCRRVTSSGGSRLLPVYRGKSGLAPGIDPTSLR